MPQGEAEVEERYIYEDDTPQWLIQSAEQRAADPQCERKSWKTNLLAGGKFKSPLSQSALCLESFFCFYCILGTLGAHLDFYQPYKVYRQTLAKGKPDEGCICAGFGERSCLGACVLDTMLIVPQVCLGPLGLAWCHTVTIREAVLTRSQIRETECRTCMISAFCGLPNAMQLVNEAAVLGEWHGSICTKASLEPLPGVTPPPHPRTRLPRPLDLNVILGNPEIAQEGGSASFVASPPIPVEMGTVVVQDNNNNNNNSNSNSQLMDTYVATGSLPPSPPNFNNDDASQQQQQQGEEQPQLPQQQSSSSFDAPPPGFATEHHK